MRDYKIRYKVLDADEISEVTLVHPTEGGIKLQAGIVEFGTKVKHRTYDEPHYKSVERSVLEEGFRNPICVMSIKEGVFAYFGTTRLAVSHRNGISIPCIIGDYVDRYPEAEELLTEEDIAGKFTDIPERIVVGNKRMNVWGLT